MNKHQPEPMKATEAKRIVLDILYRPISCVGIDRPRDREDCGELRTQETTTERKPQVTREFECTPLVNPPPPSLGLASALVKPR